MRRITLLAVLSLGTVLGACHTSPTGPANEEITGVWHATSWKYVAVSGTGQIDLITTGQSAVLTLNANLTGTLVRTPNGGAPVTASFTWARDGENISFIYGPGNDDNFVVTLSGGTLGLSQNGIKMFDVNADGTDEQARWKMAFAR